MQSRIGTILAVCATGIVAGCSGDLSTIDTPDGGRSSNGGGNSGSGGGNSGSGGSSGGTTSSGSGAGRSGGGGADSSTALPGVEPGSATAACPASDGGVTQLGMFSNPNGQFAAIRAIAADEDGVYLVIHTYESTTKIDATTVVRVPACGGPTTFLASRPSPQKTLGVFSALAASHRVFVIMGDGIYSVPTAGGAMATETTSTNVVVPSVTVYGDQLYWVEGSATLWTVKIGGANAARAVARSTAPMAWTSVAADGTNAYVTAIPLPSDGGMATASDQARGSVLSIALAGGEIATLASGVYGPSHIVVAGANLYWTSNMYLPSIDTANGTGSIEKLALGGGPLMEVVRGEAPPPGPLMVAGTTIYWIDNGGPDGEDTLRMLPAGGTPTTIPMLMPSLIGLDGLILANSGAYWYSSSDNTFGRVAL